MAAEITAREADDGGHIITIEGDIAVGDEIKFNQITRNMTDVMVFLESDGGKTFPAIKIGETIRRKNFGTAVLASSNCNSACALLWLAGTPRVLEQGGKIGFHATYVETGGQQRESGVGNALVGRYLTQLNLSERAIFFATSAPPSRLNYLNARNYNTQEIPLEVFERNEEETASASSDDNDAEIWGTVGRWTIIVDGNAGYGCAAIASEGDFVLRIGLEVTEDQKFEYYMIFGRHTWNSLKVGKKYKVDFEFDNMGKWSGNSMGTMIGNAIALRSDFSDDTIWDEFAKANWLKISYEGSQIGTISLAGSSRAVDEIIKCQGFYLRQKQDDPFRE